MYQRLFALCLSLILLLSACKPHLTSLVPVTSGRVASVPAKVELARDTCLKYVASSARLAALPLDENWQMEPNPVSDHEFQYHNGNWLIVIWLADTDEGNERVVILNRAKNTAWTGYVTANGSVVDTYYTR